MAKNGKLIAGGVAAGVIAAGGIGAYLYLKVIPAVEGTSPVASAKIVPDEALAAGYMELDSKSWDKLRQFGTPEAQKLVFGGFDQATQGIKDDLAKEQLDFAKDIQPWVGSLMVAMVPSEKNEPEMLMVVGIKDKLAALDFANKMKKKDKLQVKETKYKGVDVLAVTNGANGSPGYVAILDNHLALSDKEAVVKKAIDSAQGQPSLASDGESAKAIEESLKVDNPVAQFYIPNYGKLLEQTSALSGGTPIPPALLDQVKSVAVGMGIDNEGIRIRSIMKVNPDKVKWEFKPVPGKILAEFPANTLLSANGGGLSQQWATLIKQYESVPEFKKSLDQARQEIRQATQLDLDQDIISWMDGEMGLALIPSSEGILAPIGLGGTLVFKTSKRQVAETTLAKLDDLVQKNKVSVVKNKVDGTEVTQWQTPDKQTVMGHGWLDQETVFLAVGDPIVKVITSKPNQSLDQSEIFKSVTQSLPKSNNGYFYINMEETQKVLSSNVTLASLGFITPETDAIIKSIRGIAAAGEQTDASTLTADLLIALKPKP